MRMTCQMRCFLRGWRSVVSAIGRNMLIGCALLALLLSGCHMPSPQPKPVLPRQQVAAGITLEGHDVGGMDSAALTALLEQLAQDREIRPQNAFFDEGGDIRTGRSGTILAKRRTAFLVLTSPPGASLSALWETAEPDITGRMLSQAAVLGAYATPILDNSPGRRQNMRLTAKLISNTIITAGREFSFNTVVGEPTLARGFREAAIIGAGGRREQGIGGGMCQLSSTLYNAVLAGGLAVTERHPHSRPVDYVPPDKDATTFTDKDFRFVNHTPEPVIIRALVTNEQVIVDIRHLPQ